MKLKKSLVIGGVLVVVIGLIFMRSVNKQIIQMNNETCPVSGRPINGTDSYIHEGKEYNLCSEECKQPISENPEKYLSE